MRYNYLVPDLVVDALKLPNQASDVSGDNYIRGV